MKKKEYKTPRSKVIFLSFKNTFLDNSGGFGGIGESGENGDPDSAKGYGRFASWDEDDEY